MDIAIIGLGQMGGGMASHLLDSGHSLTVWNRDGAKAQPFADRGATVAASPEAAAAGGIVLSMLADDAAVEAVAFGEAGILSAGPGILHVSCSTVSVALTDRLAAAHAGSGQRFVSAQVLGRPNVAAAGMLAVLAAGADADLARAHPALDAIGRLTLHIGERPAMAAAAKAAANFGIAAIVQMLSEQIRIGEAQGVPAETMVRLLTETNFGSLIVGNYGPMIAEQRFEPAGFPMTLGRKDVGLAIAAGEGAALPLAELLAAQMDAIIAADGGDRDWAALGQPPRG